MMQENDWIIGQNIKSRRELLALTQEDLAKELQTSFQEVEEFEAGVKPVTSNILIRIARLFHCSLDSLCGFKPSTLAHSVVTPDDILKYEIPPLFLHISNVELRKFLYRTLVATMMLDSQKNMPNNQRKKKFN